MPAAWAGEALHPGLNAADRDGAGRCQKPRILTPRHVERSLQPAEVRPTGRKADHGDTVVATDMPRDDIVRRGVEGFGDILQVDAELPAIDHRNAPASPLDGRRNRQLRKRR